MFMSKELDEKLQTLIDLGIQQQLKANNKNDNAEKDEFKDWKHKDVTDIANDVTECRATISKMKSGKDKFGEEVEAADPVVLKALEEYYERLKERFVRFAASK